MSRDRQTRLERAKAYVLAHPDESKAQQAANTGTSLSTIATARTQLIDEGRLHGSRKTDVPGVPDPPAAPKLSKPATMLDHQAMEALASMVDEVEGMDDEAIYKRLMRQCLGFAFDTRLHPDTRMSASQMWAKLKDRVRAEDLGPGAPLTFEAAVDRMSELVRAVGARVVLTAVNRVFEEVPDGGTQGDQAPPPGGTPAPAGAA